MEIETLDDLNAVSDCCCTNGYTCPAPTAETENAHGVGSIYPYTSDATTFYSRLVRNFGDGGSIIFEATPTHASQVGPIAGYHPSNTNTPDFETTVTSTPPLTGGFTNTKEGPINIGAARSASKSAIFNGLDWASMGSLYGDWPRGTKSAMHDYSVPDPAPATDLLDLHSFRFARFRWIVPDTFEGAFFKLTWDVLEEPDGWDDTNPTVFRSFYQQDQTWQWSGPGDSADPDSWKSPWQEIPPPDVGGSRRVVNIRYQCFEATKLGTIPPNVMGEAIADDEL